MHGHAVMGEHAPRWGTHVEDQGSGGVVAYLHHLGSAHQEFRDPVAQGGVQTQGPEFSDELGGKYAIEGGVIVDEQHSFIGVSLVQVG